MVTSVIIIDKILTGLIFYPIQIGLQTEKGRFSKGIFGFKIFGLKYISKSLTWIKTYNSLIEFVNCDTAHLDLK